MDAETFKNKYPNMYSAMQANMQDYELYGIRFRSHTPLTRESIIEKVEDRRNTLYFISKYFKEHIKLNLN